MLLMRSAGSLIASGTRKRAGVKWLPPIVESEPRRLMGITMRRSSTGAPWNSW